MCFDDCNVKELNIDNILQNDLLLLYNKYSTTIGGVPYVQKETNMAFTSGFENDAEFKQWLDNPERLSSTLSCPSLTDPAKDILCTAEPGSLYDIVIRCFDENDELTEDGLYIVSILGIDKDAVGELSLKAAMVDKIYYNIMKIRWHRQFVKDTVVRYQNKGTIGAIESLFSEYILREFADYGFGSIGLDLSSTSGNDYRSGGRVAVKTFTDNQFSVEVVELLDPWDYFSGKQSEYVDPLITDPSLDPAYNVHTEEQDMPPIDTDTTYPLINMFEDKYEQQAINIEQFRFPEGTSGTDQDVATGNYSGWPQGFPYPNEPQNINHASGNDWECGIDDVAGGIELTESGQGKTNTVKGYNQYRRVNTFDSEWEEKSLVKKEEIFAEGDPCASDFNSYQEALKNGTSGVEANWGDFIANQRGTVATLQNALDQFEFDDIYHYFSFEKQQPMKYLDPRELDLHNDCEIYEDLYEWMPYTSTEEQTGINEFCPTPRNKGWEQTDPSKYVGRAVRDFEIDSSNNKFLILVPPTDQIANAMPSGGYISNPFSQTSGGVVLISHEDVDGGEWKDLDLSSLDAFIEPTDGIATMMVVGKSLMITTDTGLVFFLRTQAGGIILDNESSPVVHNTNQEFVKAKLDVENQRIMYLSKDRDFGTYSLFSYDPDRHSITPHMSNIDPGLDTFNTVVISEEVFSFDNPGFVLILEDQDADFVHIVKHRPGITEFISTQKGVSMPGFTGEVVGTHVENGSGDMMFLYNTSGNETIFPDIPDYTSAIAIANMARTPLAGVSINEPLDFVYKHYPYEGVGGGHQFDTLEENYVTRRPEFSFKTNRIKLSNYHVNDNMFSFTSVPTSGLYDYYSTDTSGNPMRIDGLFFWDNARDHGMYDNNGNIIFRDQPPEFLVDKVYNLFGHFTIPNDLKATLGRSFSQGGTVEYNFTPVKNMFGFKPETSYWLDPNLAEACYDPVTGGEIIPLPTPEPEQPYPFSEYRDNCQFTSGYWWEPTQGPTDFPYPPWYCFPPTMPPPTSGITPTPTSGLTIEPTPTPRPPCPAPDTPRRYFNAKLYDSVYFLIYDQESNLPLVERANHWYFFNKKSRKTGLFDIRINNFVFSSRLTPNEIMTVRQHIEKVIRTSIDKVKPASTVLRKIIWVRPSIEDPPMWKTSKVFFEFDDDEGWLILDDGTVLELDDGSLKFDSTLSRTDGGPACVGRIIDGAITDDQKV
jgi:hypothetical protein